MSHPDENTAMMNYGEAGIESISAVICRWRWMMKWRLRLENGNDGMDVQRMTFDPDKFRNFAALQIPTSQIENSFDGLFIYGLSYRLYLISTIRMKVIRLLYSIIVYIGYIT